MVMNQPTSTLLDLPPELRTMIYSYVFDGHIIGIERFKIYPRRFAIPVGSKTFRYTDREQARFRALIAPTQVCRQMRLENRFLPYKYSTYHYRYESPSFLACLRSLDPAAKAVLVAAWTETQIRDLKRLFGGAPELST